MKLSLIIPVYNAEKFLYKCLQSVCSQDLSTSEYEIIVINDGSTDLSEQIILEFEKNTENLFSINQENKGVSAARNVGLDIAKGAFITFVDADDYINPTSLKKILNYIYSFDIDLCYGHLETVNENGEHLTSDYIFGEYNEVKKGFAHVRRTYPGTFYKRDILRNINFHADINFGEDTLFNAKAQSFAQRVSSCDIPYYNYLFRTNSLSKQGGSDNAFDGFLLAIRDLRKFQKANFSKNSEAENYFDKVYEIFVTRMIELNIMPDWNKDNYERLVTILKELHLIYILDCFASKYPYVNRSFKFFKGYQNYLKVKSVIYNQIYRG